MEAMMAMCACLFPATPPLHSQELCQFVYQYPITLGGGKRHLDVLMITHYNDACTRENPIFSESVLN